MDKCGTYAGYNQHYRDKTPVCGPCKDASNAYRKSRLSDPKVKQKVNETSKKWREQNKDSVRESNRRRSETWRNKHPEQKKVNSRLWLSKNQDYYKNYYEENKERYKQKSREYSIKYKERKYSLDRKRRAKKYNTRYEIYTSDDVLNLYGKNCFICGDVINLEVSGRPGHQDGWEYGLNLDHVVPLSRGGHDTLDNIRPTHAICNLRKHANSLENPPEVSDEE